MSMGSEQLYVYPDPIWSRLIPWGGSVVVSALLLYLVAASGKPSSLPEIDREIVMAEAIVLPPPPDITEEPPPPTDIPPPPASIDFKTFSSKEAVTLLDVKIEPQKDQELLQKLDIRLSSESVTMADVNANYVYERKDVDVVPEAIHRVMPEVTTEEKGGKIRIRVMFTVDAKGAVGERYVLDSSHPEVNEAVLESLDLWTFLPAKKGKRPVRCWVRQTIIINRGSGNPMRL